MKFTKWQALGNDFIFINTLAKDFPENGFNEVLERTIQLCDRHFGIGADGIIFILPSDKADLRMRIFNNDGSEAEMCGNGIRAFSKWAYSLGLVNKKKFNVETGAGILTPELLDDGTVKVDMGTPRLQAEEIPVVGLGEGMVISKNLTIPDKNIDYKVTCVSMGNPHCVIFTKDVEKLELAKVGPIIEVDRHFPKKINVEFVEQLEDHKLRMRVWERGAGITMACGTGTCATVVAAILNGKLKDYAGVQLDGGILHIEWSGNPNDHVYMTGPAEMVFEGTF